WEKQRTELTRKRNRLAFEDPTWKGINQPRHFIVGYTVHGFHWCICQNEAFHERDENCVCKFCKQSAAGPDHLNECEELQGDLYCRYKTVVDRYQCRRRDQSQI